MEDQLQSAVDLYLEIVGDGRKLRDVKTPFRNAGIHNEASRPITTGPWLRCPWCKGEYDEKTFAKGTGDPSKQKGKKAEKDLLDPDDIKKADPAWRPLGERAMRILMKLLYAARLARYDLQRAINALGSYVHKWNQECEDDLYRLMSYVNSALKIRQYAWVGDNPEDIDPHLYADADFAGCTATSRSTNGAHLCLRGNNTYFSLSGTSKKQDCVSHSTPEAELVAAAFAIRKEGLPATYVWDTLLQPGQTKRKIVTVFHEDNQTMIRAVKSGRNPTMRHMGRTQYVQIKWPVSYTHLTLPTKA